MAAFDLCAPRVYRFVDAANSPSPSSFLSLSPLLSLSFSLPLFLFSSAPFRSFSRSVRSVSGPNPTRTYRAKGKVTFLRSVAIRISDRSFFFFPLSRIARKNVTLLSPHGLPASVEEASRANRVHRNRACNAFPSFLRDEQLSSAFLDRRRAFGSD